MKYNVFYRKYILVPVLCIYLGFIRWNTDIHRKKFTSKLRKKKI